MAVDTLLFIMGGMALIGYVFGQMRHWNGD